VTWHFKPFYIATNEGVREADLTNHEDAKAIKEYIEHQREKLNERRKAKNTKTAKTVRSLQAVVHKSKRGRLPAETKGKTSLRASGRCGGDHIGAGS
jgi:5-bromo-4-chloroindolyl phosphate hydrolysis protein